MREDIMWEDIIQEDIIQEDMDIIIIKLPTMVDTVEADMDITPIIGLSTPMIQTIIPT
jgi:hypothetical protein